MGVLGKAEFEATAIAVQDADRGDRSLSDLIERSAELKGELVAFGESARFDRWLTPLLLEAAGPDRQLDEGDAIRITDNYAQEPRPGVSVIGKRLSELAAGGRRPKLTRAPVTHRRSRRSSSSQSGSWMR